MYNAALPKRITSAASTAAHCLMILLPFSLLIGGWMSWACKTPYLFMVLPYIVSAFVCSWNISKFKNQFFVLSHMAVYIFILFVLLYNMQFGGVPLMGMDWSGYSGDAVRNLQTGRVGLELLFNSEITLFAKVVSLLYALFGVYPKMIHGYIFLTSHLLIGAYIKLAGLFFKDSDAALLSAFFLNLLPVYMLHSIAFLREIPTAFVFVLSMLYFFRYIETGGIWSYLLSLLFGVVAAMYHSGMIVVPFFYILSLLFYKAKSKSITIHPGKLILVVILFWLLFATPIGDAMMEKFGGAQEDLLGAVGGGMRDALDATTVYISDSPKSYAQMLLQTPYRFILFELVPLPWMIRTVGTAISWVLDSTIRMYFFYSMIQLVRHLKSAKLSNEQKMMVYVCIAIWIGFGTLCGWGVKTYGTAIRHRVKVLPMEVLLVVLNWTIIHKRTDNNRSIGLEEVQ